MKNQTYTRKTIICNLAELRFGNFIFALAGLLIFMAFKVSENVQLFFAFYVGTFMLYNVIRFFLLVLAYQHESNKANFSVPCLSVPYQTAMDAMSNNIPEEMERIRNQNKKANDGKV